MTLSPKLRLFCAMTFDEGTLQAIDRVISAPRSSLSTFRWTPRANWHLTLKFYGDVAEDLVPALGDLIASEVIGDPVTVRLRGLGAFPNPRAPRVLWVGVEEPTGRLADLQRHLEDASGRLGFEREDRRFHPHVTVARAAQGRPTSVVRDLGPLATVPIHEVALSVVTLYQSSPGPAASSYTALRTFTLRG